MNGIQEQLLEEIALINDLTEHRFGLGPLMDSYCGDKKLLRCAIRQAAKNGYERKMRL